MISSHLHFDHAGGNTTRGAGRRRPPDVSERALRDAARRVRVRDAHQRAHRGELLPAQLRAAGARRAARASSTATARSSRAFAPIPTPGHTPYHQGLLIESDGEQAFYIADLAPTVAHLPLPWIMGYDVEPLVTLETKRRILKRAVDEKWLVIFEHDANDGRGAGWRHDGKTYGLACVFLT